MLGSGILDVVIGLILIYLFYSLFATIIGEIIADIFALRAHNLEKAIAKMFGQNPEGDPQIGKIRTSIQWVAEIIGFRLFKKDSQLKSLFYGSTLIKQLSRNHLFPKPPYVSTQTFSETLIRLLADTQNKGTRQEKIRALLNSTEEELTELNIELKIDPEIRDLLLKFFEEAEEDLEIFKEKIERWFDEEMSMASGWYKSKIQGVLVVIGFSLALIFNINTIEIASKLSRDKQSQEQLVELAISFSKQNDSLPSEYYELKKELEESIRETESIVGFGWPVLEKINLPNPQQWWDNEATFFQKISHVAKVTLGSARSLLGLLLTALAISLGAPFWFDLLNRIIKIRSAFNPEEEEKK